MPIETVDVIVVGSGNAGFSAAASAKENGAGRVIVLEKGDRSWAGGNSTFTAGAYRTVFSGLQDILPLVNNVAPDQVDKIDMEPYDEKAFHSDLSRMCGGRSDPALANALISESNSTTKWLHKNGIKFQLSFNRQAYVINGRQKFWGGMVLKVEEGGKGLTEQHQRNCARLGVEVRYSSPVVKILQDKNGVTGVTVKRGDGEPYGIHAKGGVILCAGGFESNTQMRAQHLGPNWDLAYVRGTPYNTGDLLKLAINDVGAKPAGNWSGCHSTCWDFNAPSTEAGDQVLTNQYTKSGYPLGLMFNTKGLRFVDEGEDLRNYTYAKFGREILQQPGSIAFQVWDADGASWLRSEEYSDSVVERIVGNTIPELAEKLAKKGLDNKEAFLNSIDEYNEAVRQFKRENPSATLDPSTRDGLSTLSSKGGLTLGPDKTNWATPLVKGPFVGIKVTCGITFTFGGLKANADTAAVIGSTNDAIPGLYVAGEMLGGLFYGNYPGGSGLTSGAVFGRKAGREAARRVGKGSKRDLKALL